MTATCQAEQAEIIVTFDGKGGLLYQSYNTNDGLLYIEIDASNTGAEAPAAFEGGIDAFMGEWYDADGKRTILEREGDHVIEKSPDLEWYGGDVCCTEYRAELDEAAGTLNLSGITTWVSAPDSDDRRMEMDASILSETYTVVEVSEGDVMAVKIGGKTLTR